MDDETGRRVGFAQGGGRRGSVESVFESVHRDSLQAAGKTLAYVQAGGAVDPWVDKARRLVVRKGTAVHDYKFGCAVIEDASKISEPWVGHYLAAATFLLQGAGESDNPLIEKARRALNNPA